MDDNIIGDYCISFSAAPCAVEYRVEWNRGMEWTDERREKRET